MKSILRFVILFAAVFSLSNTSYSQLPWFDDFESGGGNWTLNTSDESGIGVDVSSNQWVINNVFAGFPGFGFIDTPAQSAPITSPNNNYLHIYNPTIGVNNALYLDPSLVAAFGGVSGLNFVRMSSDISTIGSTNVHLKFYWLEQGNEGKAYYSLNSGTSWTAVGGSFNSQGTWVLKDIVDANFDNQATIRFGFSFDNTVGVTAADPSFAIDDITIESVVPPTDPEVEFTTSSSGETEDNFGITIELSIASPAAVPTSVEVAFTGDASRFDSYGANPQTYVVPALATTFDIDVFFVDDDICQEIEDYTFTITNVTTAGFSPTIGTNNTHDFALTDNEMQYRDSYGEDFEFGALSLSAWNTANTDWSASLASPISGTFSLDYTATNATQSFGQTAMQTLSTADCINGVQTEWNMSIQYPVIPDANNSLAIALTGGGVPGAESGYGLFIIENPAALGTQLIGIARQDVGVTFGTPVFATGLLWAPYASGTTNIVVTRDDSGNWGISLNGVTQTDIGAPTTLGGTDNTHIHMGILAFALEHNSTVNGRLKVDDISINMHGCSEDYYSQATGDFDANIWETDELGAGMFAAVPNIFSRFEIRTGHTVTQTENTCIESLLINSGATYTFSPGIVSLGLQGDLLNIGTFTPEVTSNVTFGGHAPQTILSSTEIDFASITLANDGGGVILDQDITLSGTLLPILGDMTLGNYNLTLKSNAIGTGGIYSLSPHPVFPGDYLSDINLSGTGLIVQERHIAADAGADVYPGGWVGIGTPITSQTISDWNDNFTTTGFTGSDYEDYEDDLGTPFNNIIKFDEPTSSWIGATGLAEAIDNDKGYFVYFGAAAQDIVMYNDIRRGDVTVPITNTGAGFNLVTNPYPCEIDWKLLYANSTNVSPTIYVFDSDANTYNTYNAVTFPTEIVIASSQSFWVIATGAGSLNFTENVKVASAIGYVFERNDIEIEELTLTLSDGNTTDQSYLGFSDDATNNYDLDLDGLKFNIPFPNTGQILISSLSEDNEDLAYNYYNSLTEGVEIPVKIVVSATGEYTFGINNLNEFSESSCLFVHDLVTDEMIEVTEDFEYNFTSEEFEGIRFHILFGAPIGVATSEISCNGSSDGAITVVSNTEGLTSYVWTNENDEIILEETNSNGSSTIENLELGNYIVSISNENSLCNSMVEVIELDQPQQEEMEVTVIPDYCTDNNLGQLIIDGQNINGEYTYEISQNDEMIELGIIEGNLYREFPSGIYNVLVYSSCQTFETESDLRDPNAPQADIVLSEEAVALIDGAATIQIAADMTNVTSFGWMINDQMINTENSDLEYTFTEEGVYSVKFIGIGESYTCNVQDERFVTVSSLVSIDELVASDISIVATSNQLEIRLNGVSNANQFEIINTLGQVVLSNSMNPEDNIVIKDITSLSRGAYIVKILSDKDALYSGKFIK